MEFIRRITLIALLLLFSITVYSYPNRPIQILVPANPGGAADIVARIISSRLSKSYNNPVLVVNKAIGGATVATREVVNAEPDGHTLLMTFDTFVLNPLLIKDIGYDIEKDFTPIMLVTKYSQVMLVHSSIQVNTIPELVAKMKIDKIITAGSAQGSSKLAFELFQYYAGTDIPIVVYKGGGDAVRDLIAGHVQVMFIQAGGLVLSSIQLGKIKPLAVSGSDNSIFPNLPSISKYYPGFETSSWVGLIGPANLPDSIVLKLNESLKNILQDSEVQKLLHDQTATIVASSPKEFENIIKSDTRKWKTFILKRGIIN